MGGLPHKRLPSIEVLDSRRRYRTPSEPAGERYIIPAFIGEWVHDLVQAAALRPGERVLDLACGTGVVARAAAKSTR